MATVRIYIYIYIITTGLHEASLKTRPYIYPPLPGVPPGCEAALLACDLLFPSLLRQRLCSGTTGCLLVRPESSIVTLTTRIALLYGGHPSPPQPSPPLPFFTQNQALKKNTKNMNKCAQMTPKCYQKVCTNDTFLG